MAVSAFNILQQSPYDTQPAPSSNHELSNVASRWVPSRFNAWAHTTQGSVVIWNVYSNRMSVIKPPAIPRVMELLSHKGTQGRNALVNFLVERGFLVGAEVDEVRRFRHAFNRDHYATDRLHLFLLSSEDCNFRCKYCYERFARGTMEPWVRGAVKKYLKRQAPSLRHLRVEWFGGEPLYGIDAMADIAPVADQLAKQYSIPYTAKVTTNGYLLTPETVDRLFSWRIFLYQVTLDGPPEHHDRCRPGRDGSPTFATILENLRGMRDRQEEFELLLRINFDNDNASGLEDLLDILRHELRPDHRFRFAFRQIQRWGGPADDRLNVCGPEQATTIYERMEKELSRRGLLLAGSIHSAGGLGSQVCYAARPNSFIVGATGKLMKCTIELDTNDRNIVGLITEDGELRLDDNKMSLWTQPAFERDNNCQKCLMLPSCAGMSCPLVRFETNASPCVDTKTSFKQGLRKAAEDSALNAAMRDLATERREGDVESTC